METRRTNQQIFSLFLCNFAILFVGMGVFPLLPIYAAEFGASPTLLSNQDKSNLKATIEGYAAEYPYDPIKAFQEPMDDVGRGETPAVP